MIPEDFIFLMPLVPEKQKPKGSRSSEPGTGVLGQAVPASPSLIWEAPFFTCLGLDFGLLRTESSD